MIRDVLDQEAWHGYREESMKIVEVKEYRLRYPVQEKFANSRSWNTSRSAGVIEIVTDGGITGWGEGSGRLKERTVERCLIGHSLFAVDANYGYDVGTAIDVGLKVAENDLFWYEEPTVTDDVEDYLEIKRALPMRISGAEALAGRWAFRRLIQERALDIVQPDISIAGGFTECRKVATIADVNRVRVLPHMWGGHGALAGHDSGLAAGVELDSVAV